MLDFVRRKSAVAGMLFAGFLCVVIVIGNSIYPVRDGTMTVGIESFQPRQIISNRLWTESPIQILNTHFAKTTKFIGVGYPGKGGLPFADRLRFIFGDDNVDQTRPPFDLRKISEDDLRKLKFFVQHYSYRSNQPCPHDLRKKCTIALGWNRDRTKESNVVMLIIRIDEYLYLMIDDSLVNYKVGTE